MKTFLPTALVATIANLACAIEIQHAATTVVVYVTVPRSSTSPTPDVVIQQANTVASEESNVQSTHLPTSSSAAVLATSSASSRAPETEPHSTTSSRASSSAQTSVLQATSSQEYPEVTQAPNATETDISEPGASSPGGGAIDTEGGASGSADAAFHLSKGGLAAILVVVILVALFGIASAMLFVIAKRKQWTMRETLTRASRRLTGRIGQPKTPVTASAANRRSRRTGVRMDSPPRPGVKAVYPPGHKRGLVVDIKDPEKGAQPLDGRAPRNTRPRENTWIQKPWGDGWK